MKKKGSEISSVYGRICKIKKKKKSVKSLAENLKRRDYFEVLSALTVKLACNRIARD